MSCNCTTPNPTNLSGECLPLVADDCVTSRDVSNSYRENTTDCLESLPSVGTCLDPSWKDAACDNSGVVLLARKGSKLVKFTKSGLIKIDKGYATVVASVPLSLTTLWHRLWKTTPTRKPILGAPLPYSYAVIGDVDGNIHGIKGPEDEDAVGVWNATAKEYTQKPLSEVPFLRKGVLPRAGGLELTGYVPIAVGSPVATVRPQKVLSGKGLVFLTEVNTLDGDCECSGQNGVASTAFTLTPPNVVGDDIYVLKFSAQGYFWGIQ